jgi:hypothetical protein
MRVDVDVDLVLTFQPAVGVLPILAVGVAAVFQHSAAGFAGCARHCS